MGVILKIILSILMIIFIILAVVGMATLAAVGFIVTDSKLQEKNRKINNKTSE